jgi:hypothetical protein
LLVVALNVQPEAEEFMVIPAPSVRFPEILHEPNDPVPVKPEKLRLLHRNVEVRDNVSVPAVTFMLLTVIPPVANVLVPVAPEYVQFTTDELVLSVRLVEVEKFNIDNPLPVRVHMPLPIFTTLVPVPEQLKEPIVGLLLLVAKSRVMPIAPQLIDVTVKSVFTVTVPVPELPSIVTVSPEPGTL